MRVLVICFGLLLLLAGGVAAGAQFAPPELSRVFDSQPQVKDLLYSPTALYAGSGAAGLGVIVILLGGFTGGQPKKKPAVRSQPDTTGAGPEARLRDRSDTPSPASGPSAAIPPQPSPAIPPAAAPAAPKSKPQASAQPPAAQSLSDMMRSDPRFLNRRRVGELVTINDALKAYHARYGVYPVAEGLVGRAERGEAWIPGLTPEFLSELPHDPAISSSPDGPQYVYASDGQDYKLLARNISLVGSTPVEVLGVRIDPVHTRSPERSAFGFWTPGYESA